MFYIVRYVLSHMKLKRSEISSFSLFILVSIHGVSGHSIFRSKISHYTSFSPSYTPWHSTARHNLSPLLLQWFPHWSPRSFVLIRHSFINFTRIILCTQIKGKIMVLLCTKNLSFLWSEENCLRISFKGCHGLNIVYLELSTVPFSHIRALTLARMYLALLRKFCHLNSFLPLLLPGKSLLLLVELDFTYSMKTCLFPQSEFIFYFHVLIILCSSSFLFIYAFKNYSVKFVDNLLRAEHGN